jgi:hypothetical protein
MDRERGASSTFLRQGITNMATVQTSLSYPTNLMQTECTLGNKLPTTIAATITTDNQL